MLYVKKAFSRHRRNLALLLLVAGMIFLGNSNGTNFFFSLTDKTETSYECANCYPGAYYRKVASEYADWQGIEGVIKIGQPTLDPARYNPRTNWSWDGFNIYMGGNAGGLQEIDAGLNWAPVLDVNGRRVGDGTVGAFHAFWRNGAWNDAPLTSQCYWYPGDVVKMSVVVTERGKLRLTICDAGPNPRRIFIQEFAASYFGGRARMQFKRVNDVAQHGNEGRPVIPTHTQIVGAAWQECYLLHTVNGVTVRVPTNSANTYSMSCPHKRHVRIVTTHELDAKGGEQISIYGTPPAPLAVPFQSAHSFNGR